jgi:DNA-binding NarL/FixJ family response regulator
MAHLTALPTSGLAKATPHHAVPNAVANKDPFRVLAADSTSMGTQLLVDALARDAQFQMAEAPSSAAAILQLAKREKPHVVVLSAKLGENGISTFEVVRELRSLSPSPRVIVLLDASERTAVIEAFRAGAQGVFCRTEPFRLLAKCIQCVHAGQVWASSSQLQYVLEALNKPTLANFQRNGGSLLSAREMDVVRCVAEGLTNREVAQRLSLTEHTIKNYLFRIFDKLGVSSRVEVVLYALGSVSTHVASAHDPSAPAAAAQVRPVAMPAKPGALSAPLRKTGSS